MNAKSPYMWWLQTSFLAFFILQANGLRRSLSSNDPLHIHHQQLCSADSLQKCLSSLQSVTQSNELAMVVTKHQLIVACRKFKESLKCADRHMKRCFGVTERKVYNHVIAGARQLIRELCVPGKVQDEFLRHSECFNNVSRGGQDKCEAVYEKVVVVPESLNQVQDVEQGLKRTCCAFRSFVQCKNDVIIRQCGPEAGSFLQMHLEKISDPLIHEHCASIVYTPEDCAFMEWSNYQSPSSKVRCSSWLLAGLTMTVAFVK